MVPVSQRAVKRCCPSGCTCKTLGQPGVAIRETTAQLERLIFQMAGLSGLARNSASPGKATPQRVLVPGTASERVIWRGLVRDISYSHAALDLRARVTT